MQNDLISRSALIEYINSKEFQRRFIQSKETIQDILRTFINEQPTAYDVEKVIEKTHQVFVDELDKVLKPLPDGTEYPEEAYRLLYLNDCVSGTIRNGGKE